VKKLIAVLALLVATVASAQTKTASRTVFGIELGTGLSIPECALNPELKALGEIAYDVRLDGPDAVCFERELPPP
jgi:hypothetical protein